MADKELKTLIEKMDHLTKSFMLTKESDSTAINTLSSRLATIERLLNDVIKHVDKAPKTKKITVVADDATAADAAEPSGEASSSKPKSRKGKEKKEEPVAQQEVDEGKKSEDEAKAEEKPVKKEKKKKEPVKEEGNDNDAAPELDLKVFTDHCAAKKEAFTKMHATVPEFVKLLGETKFPGRATKEVRARKEAEVLYNDALAKFKQGNVAAMDALLKFYNETK